jgi:glucose-fructose oxidoreductase
MNKEYQRPDFVRHAVVGRGHVTPPPVSPAILNAEKNSILTPLVSDDPVKLRSLSRSYHILHIAGCDS